MAKYLKSTTLRFMENRDEDLVEWVAAQENFTKSIKELIRKIANEQGNVDYITNMLHKKEQ